ncbi:polyketide synthase protein [Rutstroemia sp. NJR-2017a BVV2]|nr:polyketide synthase protein [Rutstroemia sp. NJR-2017a BVV2]
MGQQIIEPVAIVGMACRLPGSVDSASSLWDMLIKKKSAQTSKVPKSRFDIDAYYHENLERPGSFNVLGGYFLDGPAENFDPGLFGISPIEAMWMDPQQRKILEVTYECFESAGLTLEDVAGSNTAVFVGSFTADYQQMLFRETDFRHSYSATGVDPGIISNRVGNVFNLKGPSFTINTACSSSVYAIHNACNALRSRDCTAAVAGGVNLILTVDQHMNTAKLGVLSPTSTCHTFDASADGYGRAEGAGVLYLKLLSDAIRDGDPIRGVIRSSSVNTNGKVTGLGITYPSVKGQERVMRAAYEKAHLDPSETVYLEMHGTGTPTGDPIEAKGVSNAMNDTRSKDAPLIVGAIKPNIGHSEAASGIFSVMKAAMMTETGIIPGVCGLQQVNPAIEEKNWNIKVQADTRTWPGNLPFRRASVNSFGYGGTNGHVIIEGIKSLCPSYQHGKSKKDNPCKKSASRPFLVTMSAHDKPTLARNIEAHSKVAQDYYLIDLVYTLGMRRSKFDHRAFAIASDGDENFSLPSFKLETTAKTLPQLAFIFTGQGAQWPRMGAEAMKVFPSFTRTIRSLDSILQSLDNPPTWRIEDVLLDPAEMSRLSDAELSQPVCTAIQMAIVDLLAKWGILPTATVGHSSGELAAAYAAGLVSASEAIIAAFYRGYTVKRNAVHGTMLAAGLGSVDITKYIPSGSDVVIACVNSPKSVTLSGSVTGIQEIKAQLDVDEVFCRELKTGRAYHSPQMDVVAPEYEQLCALAFSKPRDVTVEKKLPRARMFSSVTGQEIFESSLPIKYWCDNLRGQVKFDQAVSAMFGSPGLEKVKCAIEIGPHSALAGPLKQISQTIAIQNFSYVPTFVRNTDSNSQLLKMAGELFLLGYPVDLGRINEIEDATTIESTPQLLVDLPPYQWNYQKTYWAEPTMSIEQRRKNYIRHDLLGSRIVGLSERVWVNRLRHKDIPWLIDHSLGGSMVFPAAGHLSMAIEALRQVLDAQNTQCQGMHFRDTSFKVAMVIPETDDGLQVQLCLRPLTKSSNGTEPLWHSFVIESYAEGKWKTHSEGMIAADFAPEKPTSAYEPPRSLEKVTQPTLSKRWYDALSRVGFNYGPSFQGLHNIIASKGINEAIAEVDLSTESGLMTGESRYIIHPSVVDACLQLMIVSINEGLYKSMQFGSVPISIEEVSLRFPAADLKSRGKAVAWSEVFGRNANNNAQLKGESGQIILDIKGLRSVTYEAALPQQSETPTPKGGPYMGTVWKPDIDSLDPRQLCRTFGHIIDVAMGSELIIKLVDLANHKMPLRKILLLGRHPSTFVKALANIVSPNTLFTLCTSDKPEQVDELTTIFSNGNPLNVKVIPNFTLPKATESMPTSQDMVLVGKDFCASASDEMLLLVKEARRDGGHIIFHTYSQAGDSFEKKLSSHDYPSRKLRLDPVGSTVILAYPKKEKLNGSIVPMANATVIPVGQQLTSMQKIIALSCDHEWSLKIKELGAFDASIDQTLIIDDTEGTFLSTLNRDSFESLKTVLCSGTPTVWLTAGVNEGKRIGGAWAVGLIRAIITEQANAKIGILDVDVGENDTSSVLNAVAKIMRRLGQEKSQMETEVWLHNGSIHISRVAPNKGLNDLFSESTKTAETLLTAGKALKGTVVSGELIFDDLSSVEQGPLADHDIEVQVLASEVNLADLHSRILKARMIVGKIIAVGKSLDRSLLGRNVVTYTSEAFLTLVRVSYSDTRLINMRPEDVLAHLPSLCHVWNAVINSARVGESQHVLLLPAPGSFVKAFISLSKTIGYTYTLVVEREEDEKKYLEEGIPSAEVVRMSPADAPLVLAKLVNDRELAAVISQDFSPLGQEIWRHVPAGTTFVLSGGVVQESPDALPFTRGAAFVSTSVDMLYKQNKRALSPILERTLSHLGDHGETAESKIEKLSIGSFTSDSTIFTSTNDAIVTYQYEQDLLQVCKTHELKFPSDASYILVGCLGGLGRSLTAWMMARGARHFAFLSRSAMDKPEAAQLVKSLRKEGASVNVYRADATNKKEVLKAIAEESSERPIRGVVHAAMVLNDSLFENMTYAQFQGTINPKIKAAENLHQGLLGHSLDFFLMMSSISATIGNPGQANYCAGNYYLDSLALSRTLQGLPAASVVLPSILDVGYVGEHQELEILLRRNGIMGINEDEMLRGFEVAISNQVSAVERGVTLQDSQIILGIEASSVAEAFSSTSVKEISWLEDPRFRDLRAGVEDIVALNGKSGKDITSSSASSAVEQIKAAASGGPENVLQTISSQITKRLSSILAIDSADMAVDGASVASFGLDSMIGAEFRNWLFKEFGFQVSFPVLLASDLSIRILSHKVGVVLGVLEGELDG